MSRSPVEPVPVPQPQPQPGPGPAAAAAVPVIPGFPGPARPSPGQPPGGRFADALTSLCAWLPWRRARHVLWLGPHGTVTRTRTGFAAPAAPVADGRAGEPGEPPRADALFAAWCARHPDSDCDVLLSTQLLHGLLLGDDPAAGDGALPARLPLTQLQGVARRRWARYHGAGAFGWVVAVDAVAAGRPGGSGGDCRIACAPDGFDVAALRAAARRHRVRLRSVQPAWVAAWAAATAGSPSLADRAGGAGRSAGFAPSGRFGGASRDAGFRLGVIEPGAATWLGVEAGRCTALARQAIDADAWRDAAGLRALLDAAPLPADPERAWRLVGHGVALPALPGVQLVGGAAPLAPAWPAVRAGGRLPVPDFVAADARAGWPAWALCAAGAAALAVGLLDAQRLTRQIEGQRERVVAVERQLAARRVPVVSALSPSSADGAAAPRAAQAIAARLLHPWGAVLFAVEQAAAGRVQLLSLAQQAGRGALLRVEAVAGDDAALDAFIATLSASPALRNVALVRRQVESETADGNAAATPGGGPRSRAATGERLSIHVELAAELRAAPADAPPAASADAPAPRAASIGAVR